LSAAGLRYVRDEDPGYRRRRLRGGFTYVDDAGRLVRDASKIERFRKLAVPPAYEDVWICADPCGHVQATGRDARGRKQYRYHPAWRALRDETKFERMLAFGAALSRLRRRLRRDLDRPGVTREKVVAAVVRLLDVTGARVGNDEYARENGSFGLTTLRNRHAEIVRGRRIVVRFRGKGGVEHAFSVDDRRVAGIVRKCHELPGQRLFQYIDDSGNAHPVDSGQVNDYLRTVMGADFTAKDFRTWTATVRTAELLSERPISAVTSESAAKACIVEVIREVASDLHNTPAVCRKSYINSLIFDVWRNGAIERATRRGSGDAEALTLGILAAVGRVPTHSPRNGRLAIRQSAGRSSHRRGARLAHASGSAETTL